MVFLTSSVVVVVVVVDFARHGHDLVAGRCYLHSTFDVVFLSWSMYFAVKTFRGPQMKYITLVDKILSLLHLC